EAVHRPELTRGVAGCAPCLDKLPVLRKLHDPVVRAMTIRDEDVATGSGHDTSRRSEMVFVAPGNSGFTERHEDLPVRTELPHDVSGFDASLRRRGDGV